MIYMRVQLLIFCLINLFVCHHAKGEVYTIKETDSFKSIINEASIRNSGSFIQYEIIRTYFKPKIQRRVNGKPFQYSTVNEMRLIHCPSFRGTKLYSLYDGKFLKADEVNFPKHSYVKLKQSRLPPVLSRYCKDANTQDDVYVERQIDIPEHSIIDLSTISPGESKNVEWANVPILIYHRTKEEVEFLLQSDKQGFKDYYDYNRDISLGSSGKGISSFSEPLTSDVEKRTRSKLTSYLVINRLAGDCLVSIIRDAKSNKNKLFEPCRRGQYDLTGRAYRGFYSKGNLAIPPHEFLGEKKLIIGMKANKMTVKTRKDPAVLDTLEPNYALHRAIILGDVENVKKALTLGAEVNSTRLQGVTALTLSAGRRNLAVSKELLRAGADPNIAANSGFVPLTYALVVGDFALAQALIAAGAEVNPICRNERCTTTPICSGVMRGKQIAVMAWLRAKGLSLDARAGTDWRLYRETSVRECIHKLSEPNRSIILKLYGAR